MTICSTLSRCDHCCPSMFKIKSTAFALTREPNITFSKSYLLPNAKEQMMLDVAMWNRKLKLNFFPTSLFSSFTTAAASSCILSSNVCPPKPSSRIDVSVSLRRRFHVSPLLKSRPALPLSCSHGNQVGRSEYTSADWTSASRITLMSERMMVGYEPMLMPENSDRVHDMGDMNLGGYRSFHLQIFHLDVISPQLFTLGHYTCDTEPPQVTNTLTHLAINWTRQQQALITMAWDADSGNVCSGAYTWSSLPCYM